MRHVVFFVAAERFGLPLASVREVVPLSSMSRVPRAPTALRGIMNLRGRVITVVDLAVLLGVEAEPKDPPAGAKVVLLDRGKRDMGLLVREIEGVHGVENVAPVPGEALPSVRGVAHLSGGRAVTVLDAEGLDRQIAGLFKSR